MCQAASFLAGTATILKTLSQNYSVVLVYIIGFCACVGAFYTTVNFIMLTCVHEEKRASSVGWQWLIRSFTFASGPPFYLAGKSFTSDRARFMS